MDPNTSGMTAETARSASNGKSSPNVTSEIAFE
jgi:hypothetical protein